MRANRVRGRKKYAFPAQSKFKAVYWNGKEWKDRSAGITLANFTVAYKSAAAFMELRGVEFFFNANEGAQPCKKTQRLIVSVMILEPGRAWRLTTLDEYKKTKADWEFRKRIMPSAILCR